MDKETILSTALSLLDMGDAWTTGANARDVNDKPVAILSDLAVKWDMYGAILRVSFADNDRTAFSEAYDFLRGNIPAFFKNRDIESYNDICTWEDIEAMFPHEPQ